MVNSVPETLAYLPERRRVVLERRLRGGALCRFDPGGDRAVGS